MPDTGISQPVIDVRPSAYFLNARVILLQCGHRHVRPDNAIPPIGSMYPCYACDDMLPPWHDPNVVTVDA